jgi:hypothetical protein
MVRVKFCRQRPAGHAFVHAVFHTPGGELAVTIERVLQPAVADDVVDGSETIVGSADGFIEERVLTITLKGGGENFEDLVKPD